MNKKKLLYMILLMISVIITGTLAYFTIVTERTALVLTLGEQDEVLVTLEPFEINGTLSSTVDYTSFETNSIDNDYIQITAENFSAIPKKVLFYYRINSIENTLISTKLKYTITSSSTINGTYSEVKTGNFSTAAEGHDLTVYEFDIPANTTIFYRVFTYLDGNENVSSMAGSVIETEFRAEMEHVITPELDTGMIPVTISSGGTVKTIAETDDNWFDYENHIWANIVLVTESSRSNYLGTTGVTVSENDILAYFVWIPRYEYRYNNLGTSYAGGTQASPGAITINFIPSYITLPTSSAYKIHPAFTFGDTELNGFWVGKFETTGTDTVPTILPNEVSIPMSTNMVQAFNTSLKFTGSILSNGIVTAAGSSYYGTTSSFDSHAMKNSEWGAMAYLTQSLYGKCSAATTCIPMAANNSTSYLTGSSDEDTSSGSTIASTSANGTVNWPTSSKVSTTYHSGTVSANQYLSGIYDTSGGKWEQTMGVVQYDSDYIFSGNRPDYNSGFVGYIASNSVLYDTSDYTPLPPQKYYDRYTSTAYASACNGEPCYGHSQSETLNWYNNATISKFSQGAPWTVFGGTTTHAKGIFTNSTTGGGGGDSWTFRTVIVNTIPNSTITGATMLISKANDASITTYSEGATGEMYTFSQPATVQVPATTDYRYIGSNPNNYISFNNETWRIIGVFDGRIKIMRNESIGSMRWDYKETNVGSSVSSSGSNYWVDSQLMFMLNSDSLDYLASIISYTYNEGQIYDTATEFVYQAGCQPTSFTSAYYSCTENTWSLNDTALSQISHATNHLGGISTINGISAEDCYISERSSTPSEFGENRNRVAWNAKVHLIYLSDYGYTFAYGVDEECYNNLSQCGSGGFSGGAEPTNFTDNRPTNIQMLASTISDTTIPSWMSDDIWTITSRREIEETVYYIDSITDTYYRALSGYPHETRGVKPVVYLKPSITLSGTGTSDDPYVIVS